MEIKCEFEIVTEGPPPWSKSEDPPTGSTSEDPPTGSTSEDPPTGSMSDDPPLGSQDGSEHLVTERQLEEFLSELLNIFRTKAVNSIPFDEFRVSIMAKTKFGEALVMACIEQLSEDYKVMLAKNTLYLFMS